jgi:hypothetical protein
MHGDICRLVTIGLCESSEAGSIPVYHPISHSHIVLQHESILYVGCKARVSLPSDLIMLFEREL